MQEHVICEIFKKKISEEKCSNVRGDVNIFFTMVETRGKRTGRRLDIPAGRRSTQETSFVAIGSHIAAQTAAIFARNLDEKLERKKIKCCARRGSHDEEKVRRSKAVKVKRNNFQFCWNYGHSRMFV